MITYWKIFRLIFVLFSLYLVGDAFYRWDGFKHYASFSEFLPSIALIIILWTLVVILTSLLLWIHFRLFEWFSQRLGLKVKLENLLVFAGVFVLLGLIVWAGKRHVLPQMISALQLKLILLLGVALNAIFITWLLRRKSEQLIDIIQERITPLVWLFSILLIISVPLVTYHTLVKQGDKVISQINCKPVEDKGRPNIILVIFDTLAARNMSFYGYHRPTTPFISKLAKKSSFFTRLEAEGNITTPTTASIMTGKRLWTHRVYYLEGSKLIKGDIESLPLLLKNNGYSTMAFVVNAYASVKALGITNGFEIAPLNIEFSVPRSLYSFISANTRVLLYRLYGDTIKLFDWIIKKDFILYKVLKLASLNVTETEVPPDKAFDSFLTAINDNLQKPFFAWIHLYPPHTPYLPPEPYMGMFNTSLRLRTAKSHWKVFKDRSFVLEVQSKKQNIMNIMRDRYDEFIRYCDKQFEDFIGKLERLNKLENTVIILTSDHGESFKHGYLGHGGPHLYEQVTHIPLIIKEGGQSKGLIINDLVEQIDIPPTILDLAHIPAPSWMEGQSLVPLMRGKEISSEPAFSMALESNPGLGKITDGTIAVWENDYKLIHYIKKNKSLLFNLKQDPDELNNLFDKEPEVGHRLLAMIQDNLRKANEKISK